MTPEYFAARPHLHGLARQMQSLLELADEMYVRGRSTGESVEYAEFEKLVGERSAAVEREVHAAALSSLDVDAPLIRVWGKHYRRVHRQTRSYATLAGQVPVTRTLYREVGRRRAPTLDPVSLRVGAVNRSWLPQTARVMAFLVAQGTSREAARVGEEMGRARYSRSSFERVGHAVGREYAQRRQVLEAALIEAFEVPRDARSVSISVDRVSIAMEEPVQRRPEGQLSEQDAQWLTARMRDYVPKTREERRSRAQLRELKLYGETHAPAKIARNYRQAYCATVTLHDEDGEALHTIRYGRMPAAQGSVERYLRRNAHEVMQRLQQDVLALRAVRPDLEVVLLADGAPELWNLLQQYFDERMSGITPTELVDAWHVLEYVAAAARLVEARGKGWPGLYRRWKTKLLRYEGGAQTILRALKATKLERATDADGKQPVGDAIRYIEARLVRLNYAAARARGLPIGSGAVEATCKSLVALRMKRAGARWKPKTGNEVLCLRALELSDRWDDALPRMLKPLRKSVQVVDRAMAGAA